MPIGKERRECRFLFPCIVDRSCKRIGVGSSVVQSDGYMGECPWFWMLVHKLTTKEKEDDGKYQKVFHVHIGQ